MIWEKDFQTRAKRRSYGKIGGIRQDFDLDEKIIENFKNGEITCSCQEYADEAICNEESLELFEEGALPWAPPSFIEKYEKAENALVYHVEICDNCSLLGGLPSALLYVGGDKELWEEERLKYNEKDNTYTMKCFFFDSTCMYAVNFDDPKDLYYSRETMYVWSKEGIITMGNGETALLADVKKEF
ncbi:MAG: hypothetical protein HDT44_07950 [Ruminococcaceae bacterium]|nr:hypothetical protein [Oscillospiraceae bacterium]